MTKHIGIASITAEGGSLAFREIVHASELILGKDRHPEISLHSFPFANFTDVLNRPELEETWAKLMIELSRKLALSGAEFFICPANTNHIVFSRVRDEVIIPWVHIASVVADRAADLKCKRALLLGTKPLMQSPVYNPFFEARNIELRLPRIDEQNEIFRIIYEELIRGAVLSSSRNFIELLIRKYVSQEECDAVIFGCTELPLLLGQTEVPILDSTQLVAHGAIAFSLGMTLLEVENVIAMKGTTSSTS